jgi:hypothetical protein
MAENQCGKCGEMVDEAKAFCPGCGNSVVDEKKRSTVSDFDASNQTVQLGETMFNQMLSEMGLSISKHPEGEQKKAEVVTPLATAAPPPVPKREAKPVPAPENKGTSRTIKIALIVVGVLAFAALVMLATVAALFFYYR